jgi:hypothetical protein
MHARKKKRSGRRGLPVRALLSEAVSSSSRSRDRDSPWWQLGTARGGARRREDGRRRQSVTAVEGVLLGRPGPAVGRGSVRVAGNARRSGSSAGSGELDGKG